VRRKSFAPQTHLIGERHSHGCPTGVPGRLTRVSRKKGKHWWHTTSICLLVASEDLGFIPQNVLEPPHKWGQNGGKFKREYTKNRQRFPTVCHFKPTDHHRTLVSLDDLTLMCVCTLHTVYASLDSTATHAALINAALTPSNATLTPFCGVTRSNIPRHFKRYQGIVSPLWKVERMHECVMCALCGGELCALWGRLSHDIRKYSSAENAAAGQT